MLQEMENLLSPTNLGFKLGVTKLRLLLQELCSKSFQIEATMAAVGLGVQAI